MDVQDQRQYLRFGTSSATKEVVIHTVHKEERGVVPGLA